MRFFSLILMFFISSLAYGDSIQEKTFKSEKRIVKIPIHAKKKRRKGVNCKIHKLFCTIVGLNPSLDKAFAMKLSNAVYKASKRHGTDPYRSIAIAMQESSLRMVNRTSKEVKTNKRCDEYETCRVTVTTTTAITDVGIFQFNTATVKKLSLDMKRLLTDVNYAANQHVMFLVKKIQMCKKIYPKTAWACYHSATPEYHKKYIKAVNRYYHGSK